MVGSWWWGSDESGLEEESQNFALAIFIYLCIILIESVHLFADTLNMVMSLPK